MQEPNSNHLEFVQRQLSSERYCFKWKNFLTCWQAKRNPMEASKMLIFLLHIILLPMRTLTFWWLNICRNASQGWNFGSPAEQVTWKGSGAVRVNWNRMLSVQFFSNEGFRQMWFNYYKLWVDFGLPFYNLSLTHFPSGRQRYLSKCFDNFALPTG